MTMNADRFPYGIAGDARDPAHALPYLPIVLEHGNSHVHAHGLIDSGSTLNVLPYHLGLQLGATWAQQTISVPLTGNLSDSEARALLVWGTIGSFPRVRLAFAWSRNERVPLILGQANFFVEYEVCFFGARGAFEVRATSA